MYSLEGKPRWRYVLPAVLMILLVLAAGIAAWALTHHRRNQAITTSTANTGAVQPAVTNTHVSGRYLFNGTVVWARAVEQVARGDYNQPFSQLDSFGRESMTPGQQT
jgi:hypothetical protein